MTLYFVREFVTGRLVGLRHTDQITFPTTEGCVAWSKAVNAPKAVAKNGWKLVDKSFQKFAR